VGIVGSGVLATRQSKFDSVMLDTIGLTGAYPGMRTNLDAISSGDGTSMTAMFTEKNNTAFSPQAYYDVAPPAPCAPASSPQYSFTPGLPGWSTGTGRQPYGPIPCFGIPQDPSGSLVAPTGVMVNSTTTNVDGAYSRPSSNHPGGVLVTYCDGHTSFMRDAITPNVYCHLLTPNSIGTINTSGQVTSSNITYQAMGGTPLGAAGTFNPTIPLSEADFN
jgi:hypothetical protein